MQVYQVFKQLTEVHTYQDTHHNVLLANHLHMCSVVAGLYLVT